MQCLSIQVQALLEITNFIRQNASQQEQREAFTPINQQADELGSAGAGEGSENNSGSYTTASTSSFGSGRNPDAAADEEDEHDL